MGAYWLSDQAYTGNFLQRATTCSLTRVIISSSSMSSGKTIGVREMKNGSLNGIDAVTLQIKKRSGENIIHIADEVRDLLERRAATFPPGTEISIVGDQSEEIRTMVHELENNIITALLLVMIRFQPAGLLGEGSVVRKWLILKPAGGRP